MNHSIHSLQTTRILMQITSERPSVSELLQYLSASPLHEPTDLVALRIAHRTCRNISACPVENIPLPVAQGLSRRAFEFQWCDTFADQNDTMIICFIYFFFRPDRNTFLPGAYFAIFQSCERQARIRWLAVAESVLYCKGPTHRKRKIGPQCKHAGASCCARRGHPCPDLPPVLAGPQRVSDLHSLLGLLF